MRFARLKLWILVDKIWLCVLIGLITSCTNPQSEPKLPPTPFSLPVPSIPAEKILTPDATQKTILAAQPTIRATASKKPEIRSTPDWDGILTPVLSEGGIWHVLVLAPDGGEQYQYHAGDVIHPASVIKVPLAMATLAWLETRYPSLREALATGPVGAGRSYEQLLKAALVFSEEDAAQILEQELIDQVGAKKLSEELSGWGAPKTTYVPRRSSADDMCNLLSALFDRHQPSLASSRLILSWMAEKTSGDTVRLWRLSEVLPEGSTIYNKRGSLINPLIVADAGIIDIPAKGAYKICMFGYPDDKTTFEDLDRIIGDFALTWYRHLP